MKTTVAIVAALASLSMAAPFIPELIHPGDIHPDDIRRLFPPKLPVPAEVPAKDPPMAYNEPYTTNDAKQHLGLHFADGNSMIFRAAMDGHCLKNTAHANTPVTDLIFGGTSQFWVIYADDNCQDMLMGGGMGKFTDLDHAKVGSVRILDAVRMVGESIVGEEMVGEKGEKKEMTRVKTAGSAAVVMGPDVDLE